MIATTLDIETPLIAPGMPSPPPSWAATYHPQDGIRMWPTARIPEAFARAMAAGPVLGQNISYDFRCAAAWHPELRPAIWAHYESGLVQDTMVAQRIIEIQRGDTRTDLSLSMLGRLWHVDVPDKTDEATRAIRLDFGRHYGASALPPAHVAYLTGDVTAPGEIFAKQIDTALVSQRDLAHLCRQSFWTGLVGGWGFRTCPDRVAIFSARVEEHLGVLRGIAREHGFLRADGTKDTKVLKCAMIRAYSGIVIAPADLSKTAEDALVAEILALRDAGARDGLAAVPLSASEKSIGTDKIAREDALEDEALQDLATWGQWQTCQDSVLPVLERGAVEPGHSKFSILNTTRTATSPQQQNLPKGHAPHVGEDITRQRVWGVRECFVPRGGKCFVTTDAKGLENCALAQCIVWATGHRGYADKINAGRDPLSECGAAILEISYEEFVARRKAGDAVCDDARSAAKPAVYGMSGGMSRPETLQGYARRGYGLSMTLERTAQVAAANKAIMAQDGRQAWLDAADVLRNALGRYDVPLCPQLTDLIRLNVSRTDSRNNPFQFVGAHVMSNAAWAVCRGQYLTGECPANLMTFVHDDLTSEADPDVAHEVALYQERCIEAAGAAACPDVKWAGDSRALTHLSKAAKATRNTAGRLLVTEVAL